MNQGVMAGVAGNDMGDSVKVNLRSQNQSSLTPLILN